MPYIRHHGSQNMPPCLFLAQGWKLVGLKLVTPGRALVERHYEEHVGKVRGGGGGANKRWFRPCSAAGR